MAQFDNPRVIHPLVAFTFGVNCGVPFPLHARKGKSCMWLLIKFINFGEYTAAQWSFVHRPWKRWKEGDCCSCPDASSSVHHPLTPTLRAADGDLMRRWEIRPPSLRHCGHPPHAHVARCLQLCTPLKGASRYDVSIGGRERGHGEGCVNLMI